MRFPIDPPPPPGVVDNPYQVEEKAAIKGMRPLGPSPESPPQALPRHAPIEPVQRRETREDTRTGVDRRKADRRQYALPVSVDTRLGRDRRMTRRRPDDPPPPSIDEKA